MLQLVHNHIFLLTCLLEARLNCFTDVKPRNLAKAPWTKCPGCTRDHSRPSIYVKSFQTPKLPNNNKLVDILWISLQDAPGALRASCQAQTPKLPQVCHFPWSSHHASRTRALVPSCANSQTPRSLPFVLPSWSCSRLAGRAARLPDWIKAKLSTTNLK